MHLLVLWAPAHLTQTAFLLQFVEECPSAAIALYGGFVGFIFLPVNLDVFDETILIDIG